MQSILLRVKIAGLVPFNKIVILEDYSKTMGDSLIITHGSWYISDRSDKGIRVIGLSHSDDIIILPEDIVSIVKKESKVSAFHSNNPNASEIVNWVTVSDYNFIPEDVVGKAYANVTIRNIWGG